MRWDDMTWHRKNWVNCLCVVLMGLGLGEYVNLEFRIVE